MTRKDRVMIFLSSYFLGVLGLFFFGTFLFFLIPLSAFIYLLIGGKKHV